MNKTKVEIAKEEHQEYMDSFWDRTNFNFKKPTLTDDTIRARYNREQRERQFRRWREKENE